MKKLISQIKKANTIDELKSLKIGNVYSEISHRGGGIGFYSSDVAIRFDVDEYNLPGKFGAGCNYLGGGIRGSIFPSTFSDRITGPKAEALNELAKACVRVYENIENESGLNDDEYEDGDTNWEAKATKSCREAKITSAY